jgi:competence protein ComGC
MKSDLIIFIIIIVVIIILLLCNFNKENDSSKEGFLSGFRQMYRPYIRKARLYTTSKYNSFSSKLAVFLRKNGFW